MSLYIFSFPSFNSLHTGHAFSLTLSPSTSPHTLSLAFSLHRCLLRLRRRSSLPLAVGFSLAQKVMKQLLRRLSRVADSSQYSLLRSDSQSRRPRRGGSFRSVATAKIRRSRLRMTAAVPEGHVPIYVGDEMERFVVSAELLNHPIFVKLLNQSAQEYGYEQKGVLRIPCHVFVFERVLEALRLGHDTRDIQDLLSSSSEEFF